jgi:diacylglycerol kinase (ATP)
VDAGRVTADGRVHYFDNNSALAMEPMVTLENIRMTRLSGNVRYLAALVRGLIKLRAWEMRITWEGGEHVGPAYLLSVCNGRRTGGLFPMAPRASFDDGLFDFVFAPRIPKATVLVVLIRLMRGTHIEHRAVTSGRTARLAIQSTPGSPLHTDGEIVAEQAADIRYDLLPGKITLIVP